MMKLAAEIIGIAAVLLNGFVYLQKTRSRILLIKLATDMLWILNFTLMGGYTGALVSMIALVRDFVFYQRGRHKWADHHIWLYTFMILVLISPVMEWKMDGQITFLPLLPALGSMFTVVSCFVLKTKSMRTYGFIGQLLWIYYNFALRNYAGLASNAMVIVTAFLGNWREKRETSHTEG